MKATSHSRWKFERKPSAKPSFRWRWFRQRRVCGRGFIFRCWLLPASLTAHSEDWEIFRPVLAGVRIYYLKMRFLKGIAGVLRVQFCSSLAQNNRKFLAESSIDDEKHTSKQRKRRTRLDGPKHSVSTVVAHEKPVDATIIFDGCPSRNRSLFPVAFIGRCGREFQTAFCVPDTSLPVCLRAEFPFGGRIDGQNKKSLCNKMKQSLLKAS
ncbi:MAG: hypothetical protein ABSH48_26580 [Verrucomicrobiota bacterium]|jgi:hypothetical protein